LGSEIVDKSLEKRVSWNRQILEKAYWYYPVDDKGYEDFMPVGRGVPASDYCGLHRGFVTCNNVEGHKGHVFKGQDTTGKVLVRQQHFWCKKSVCPVCFIRGWSVRGANKIEARLNTAVNRGFGKVEHIVVSLPDSDYGLWYEHFRRKVLKIAFACRVIGGCMIFHGFRIDSARKVLAWSPHFHVLGFIGGGYDVCRRCKGGDCYKCGGTDGASYRIYRKSGYIVRVLDERLTVFGTAWYQLNHATTRIGIKRFPVITWFGKCGYRNFKADEPFFAGVPCDVCCEIMDRGFHVGKRHIVKHLGRVGYARVFLDDEFDESGKPNYVD
jgi:hypothetical protein